MKVGKKMILAAVAVAAAGAVTAGTTYSRYGNHEYGSRSDGTTETWSTYGNHSYGRDSRGNSKTCSTYGGHTYCN